MFGNDNGFYFLPIRQSCFALRAIGTAIPNAGHVFQLRLPSQSLPRRIVVEVDFGNPERAIERPGLGSRKIIVFLNSIHVLNHFRPNLQEAKFAPRALCAFNPIAFDGNHGEKQEGGRRHGQRPRAAAPLRLR